MRKFKQNKLWRDKLIDIMENNYGFRIYWRKLNDTEFIEFDSMINIRPAVGNRSRGIDNPKIQEKIKKIVSTLVEL